MNGKDVQFVYNEETYIWAGDGAIRHWEVEPKYGDKIRDVELSKEEFTSFLSSLPKENPESVAAKVEEEEAYTE